LGAYENIRMGDKNMKRILLLVVIILTACGESLPGSPTATHAVEGASKTVTPLALISTPLPTATTEPTVTLILEPSTTATWSVPFGSDDPRDYIGLEIPPYPSGYPKNAGWIWDESIPLSLAYYRTQDESSALIFLERFLPYDSKGNPHSLIVDAVVLNNIPNGEKLFSDCYVDEILRADLIVLGKVDPNDDTRFIIIIDRIWQADAVNEHLHELEPKSIECILHPGG
jgi:hypothetical protein